MGKRGRLLSGLFSVSAHGALLLALFMVKATPPEPPPIPEPLMVSLVGFPNLPPAPEATPEPEQKPVEEVPKTNSVRPTPSPRVVPTLAAAEEPTEEPGIELSDAQLASASRAGSGGGGRPCDMIEFLEQELRKDPRIQQAVNRAHQDSGISSKAIMVWDGDWIKSRGQEGRGIAGVREAIMTEVAFAPAACRADPVRGLVVLSLHDSPSAPRIALGSGAWRWSDLLHARGAVKASVYR